MKLNHPAWARTTDINLAAALSTLGVRIEVDQTEDVLSGRGWRTILLGLESVPIREIGGRVVEGEETAPTFQTAAVLALIRGQQRNGTSIDPHHAALDVLRACKARECLLQAVKTGKRFCLARVAGAQRMGFIEGEEPQAIKNAAMLFRTRDIKLAAALSVLGAPLARIEEEGTRHAFVFSQLAYSLGGPPIVPGDLAQAWRTKRLESIEEQHPLLWMMQGLINRDAIEDFLKHQKKLQLIRAPGTGRACLVREGITGAELDKKRRFLRIAA